MIIKLFDGMEYAVSRERGEEIARAMAKSNEGLVRLGGGFVKLSAIKSIMPGGQPEDDRTPNDPNLRLQADSRTNNEIHKAARKKSAEVRKKLEQQGIIKPK